MKAESTQRVQTSTKAQRAPTSKEFKPPLRLTRHLLAIILSQKKKKIHLSATCGYNSQVLIFQYYFCEVKYKTIEKTSNQTLMNDWYR